MTLKKLNEKQLSVLSGSIRFFHIIGDIVSSKTFDAISLMRKQSEYRHNLKRLTEQIDRRRKSFERCYSLFDNDLEAFANLCEYIEEINATQFSQTENVIKLALGARKNAKKEVNLDLYTKLMLSMTVSYMARQIRDVVYEAVGDLGVKFRNLKADPSCLFEPTINLITEYAGKDGRDDVEKILRNDQVKIAVTILARNFCEKLLPAIMAREEKRNEKKA